MIEKINGVTILYEQVARMILNSIADGIYTKGDILPSEKDLIEMTGVSRITVREALKKLAEMGVIETRKGKGSFVLVDPADLRLDGEAADIRRNAEIDFINSTKARLLLEPAIAKEAARNATPEDIAALEMTLPKRMKSGRFEEIFDSFHVAIAKAAHNPYMLSFVEQLINAEMKMNLAAEKVMAYKLPENQNAIAQELNKQHRKIFEAIRDGNEEFAYFYMKEHISYLEAVYKEFNTWFLT